MCGSSLRNVVMQRIPVLETTGHALVNVTFRCSNARTFHADAVRCRSG